MFFHGEKKYPSRINFSFSDQKRKSDQKQIINVETREVANVHMWSPIILSLDSLTVRRRNKEILSPTKSSYKLIEERITSRAEID